MNRPKQIRNSVFTIPLKALIALDRRTVSSFVGWPRSNGTDQEFGWGALDRMMRGGYLSVGDNIAMRYVASIILFGAMCFAEQTRKPVCNASNQGQFWPEEANSSQD